MSKNKRVVKYPENLEINAKLQIGDRGILARYSGYKAGTVRDKLNGFSPVTDRLKRAIIRLMQERHELNNAIEEIKNQ